MFDAHFHVDVRVRGESLRSAQPPVFRGRTDVTRNSLVVTVRLSRNHFAGLFTHRPYPPRLVPVLRRGVTSSVRPPLVTDRVPADVSAVRLGPSRVEGQADAFYRYGPTST